VAVALEEWPAESFTKTLTLKDPTSLGTHERDVVLEDAQPVGKPEYAYFRVPVPP
jgi:hypothetical protein